MASSVAVVVPYRPDGGGPRDRHWAPLAALWRGTFPTWDLREGLQVDGPWCKAAAAAAALDGCTADVLVVADADVWCEPVAEVARAVELVAERRRPWAVPHRDVVRLSEAGAGRWLAGEREGLDLDQAPYRGVAGGGLFVVRRTSWDLLGGFDRRFVGWGQEDRAFGLAADCLLGVHRRLTGRLWHLWHPPQPRTTRAVGSQDGQRLLAEYRRVGRDRARMAEFVAQHREAQWHEPAASASKASAG